MEPFDAHGSVTDRLDTTVEMGRLAFDQIQVFDFTDKTRRAGLLVGGRGRLISLVKVLFQLLDRLCAALEALGQLRFQHDTLTALDLKSARDGRFSVLVAGLASVESSISGVDSRHFQDDESEIGDGLDPRAGQQRFSVVEPLDTQAGIADGRQLAFEMGQSVFRQQEIARLAQKFWWFASVGIGHLVSRAAAQSFQFGDPFDGPFHSLGQLRLEDDVPFALAFERSRSDGLAEFVGGAARILAGIFRIDGRNLQDDETKVAERADARARLEGFAVEEPFDLEKK